MSVQRCVAIYRFSVYFGVFDYKYMYIETSGAVLCKNKIKQKSAFMFDENKQNEF